MNILVVEDEAIIALSRKTSLLDNGFKAVIAANGQIALGILKATNIDIILMDVNLGANNQDGIQVAREIRKTQDTPIIFLSSYIQNDIGDFRDIKNSRYMSKLIQNSFLIEEINRWVKGKST